MSTTSAFIAPVLVRLREAESRDGKRKSTRYSEIAEGLMVPPISTGSKQSAWLEYELIAINLGRIAGLDEHCIRQLVSALLKLRGKLITWDDIKALIDKLAAEVPRHVPPPIKGRGKASPTAHNDKPPAHPQQTDQSIRSTPSPRASRGRK